MEREQHDDRQMKLKAMVHLVIVVLVVIGLVLCAVRVFRGSGTTERKSDKNAWNSSYTDRSEPRRNYAQLFNDLQDTQLNAAQRNGIREPITRENIEQGVETNKDGKVVNQFGMVRIATNDLYVVDDLTHSVPWLVPKAAKLLDDIGQALQDSLYRRGYNRHHRFIITSVTRTRNDVQRLKRQNVNATENSCHCYGTTIDITYNRYDKPETHAANDDKMRQLLMQCVYDLQQQKRCYVKYERKQACLHITVR